LANLALAALEATAIDWNMREGLIVIMVVTLPLLLNTLLLNTLLTIGLEAILHTIIAVSFDICYSTHSAGSIRCNSTQSSGRWRSDACTSILIPESVCFALLVLTDFSGAVGGALTAALANLALDALEATAIYISLKVVLGAIITISLHVSGCSDWYLGWGCRGLECRIVIIILHRA
jgi:hypothetical protein